MIILAIISILSFVFLKNIIYVKGGSYMNAVLVAILGLVIFALGYRFYSKFIAEKIFRLDPNYVTPAHKYKDGVDFVPTNHFVFWVLYFLFVAGVLLLLC